METVGRVMNHLEGSMVIRKRTVGGTRFESKGRGGTLTKVRERGGEGG